MSKKANGLALAEEFDMEPTQPPVQIVKLEKSKAPKKREDDVEFVRQNQIAMQQGAMVALEELMNIALTSQDPEHFGQVSKLMSAISAAQETLLKLKIEEKDGKKKKFVMMSASDLQNYAENSFDLEESD